MKEVKRMVEELVERIRPDMEKKGFCVMCETKIDNKIEKHGILVRMNDENEGIGAVVYYEPEWKEMKDDEIMDKLVAIMKKKPDVKVAEIMDREYVLNNVKPLIQDIANEELLKGTDMFYVVEGSFVMLFYIPVNLDDAGVNGQIKIRKSFLNNIEVSEKELIESAMEHLKRDLSVRSMSEIMSEMMGLDMIEEDVSMYVISNKETYYGSAGILLEETYEKLSPILGPVFVILPSSLHECIAVPYTGDKEDYLHMVMEVNETQVSAEEKLADHVYIRDMNGVHTLI